ncbi:MAG: hypothetical protein ACKV2V_11215 [Blastocatellia bacterium]
MQVELLSQTEIALQRQVPVHKGWIEEVYGLITVLPSEGATDSAQRTIILSGVTSAGMQAAAEFFASPSGLLAFPRKLQAAGQAQLPRAYQVVVKVHSDSILPLSFQYEMHRVLQP